MRPKEKHFMVRCQNIFLEVWIAMSNLRALNNPRQAAGPESSLRALTLTCLKRKTNRLEYNHFENIWAEFDCYISSFGSIK